MKMTTTMLVHIRRESSFLHCVKMSATTTTLTLRMPDMADSRASARTMATASTMYRYENGRTYHAYSESTSKIYRNRALS